LVHFLPTIVLIAGEIAEHGTNVDYVSLLSCLFCGGGLFNKKGSINIKYVYIDSELYLCQSNVNAKLGEDKDHNAKIELEFLQITVICIKNVNIL